MSLARTLQNGADKAFDADPVGCWIALLVVILILVFSKMAFSFQYKIRRDRNRVRHDILRTVRELNLGSQEAFRGSGVWRRIFGGRR